MKDMAKNIGEKRTSRASACLVLGLTLAAALTLPCGGSHAQEMLRGGISGALVGGIFGDAEKGAAIGAGLGAIRKIDKETRNRFRDTFDRVNNGLQALFPRVFGGGSAYLEMTGEDLLDTGISIMARPPGKKNSTIHLLSGGEKALTAIALVFSIFQLNPAPFCMLDEVDAPLDDANVARYARMVKEMSETVQFIYITHNKISMELADQLMGVTMHEPGVSRLVSVDVEEAAELAAS